MRTTETVNALRCERKRLRAQLARRTELERDAYQLAGEALALLDLACTLLAALTGRDRENVLQALTLSLTPHGHRAIRE